MIDPQGNTVAVDVTALVGQQLTIGGIVANCKKEDYTSGDQLYKVITYNEQRDAQNRFISRTVGLKRCSKTLPSLAS